MAQKSKTPKVVLAATRRNLFLKIPTEKKEQLRDLAKQSGMTMESYASAVIEEAIDNGDLFKFVKIHARKLAVSN